MGHLTFYQAYKFFYIAGLIIFFITAVYDLVASFKEYREIYRQFPQYVQEKALLIVKDNGPRIVKKALSLNLAWILLDLALFIILIIINIFIFRP